MSQAKTPLPEDARYRYVSALSHQGADRAVYLATDRLTGTDVIVKTSALALAVQEARALLAVPTGIAPRLQDARWDPAGGLHLIMEKLAGRTLLEAAPEMEVVDLPRLVARICQCLGALHRTGFMHCDIKPANIFVLANGDVRLLDLGFAQSRFTDALQERGGRRPS